MTGDTESPEQTPRIRTTYEEYDLGNARVAMISDPENSHAWIQSTVVEPVEP